MLTGSVRQVEDWHQASDTDKIKPMKRLITLFVLLPISLVVAQGVPTSVQGINLVLSTDNPSPGQAITITAESYISDINSSNITWSLNGSLYQKGVGLTSIRAEAPELGKRLNITVTAITSDGRTLDAAISIGSGNIDLILESDGYTPPFFKGKIPLAYQNAYRVVAVPHLADPTGAEYDPRTLVYQWTKDTRVVQDASGYGRQVFSWKDEMVPRSRIISVKVSARDGTAQAEKAIIFEASNPFIGFYTNDPLYGPLYDKTLGESVGLGSKGELSVLAVPFGFNKSLSDSAAFSDGTDDLSFSWMINSIAQTALSASESIVLRAPEGQGGSSNISLEIRNASDILQGARNGFAAVFSAKNPDGAADDMTNFNGI